MRRILPFLGSYSVILRHDPQSGPLIAKYPRHLGRRHRLEQLQLLPPRHDGWSHAQHRPCCPRRCAVYRLLCPAKLHGWSCRVHHWPAPVSHGLAESRYAGAKQGLQDKDPTIAELLKPHGYATAQIGKNHLGDRNEYLPTVHGFDEFYGNLYHLNAEEEPEDPQYPKDKVLPNGKTFYEQFGPRGVLHCKATDTMTPPKTRGLARVGKQTIEDTGPLTRERMRTVEEDLLKHSLDFIDRSHGAGKPFFLWHNLTRMHVFTHLSDEWKDKTGYGLYADGMAEFDWVVGQLLKKLDDLGIADNTIVIVSTDNGAEVMTWPDGGCTPFHGEKGTTWEGGMRVPCVVRWPGVVKPGTIVNEIMSHEDWAPTFLAAAGDPDVKEKLLKGHKANGKTFKTHLDGHNFMPFFKGEVGGRAAQGDLLLRRQRKPQRRPRERLEDPLRDPGGQSAGFRTANGQHALRGQSPAGSLRAVHAGIEDVLPLVRRQDVDVRPGANGRGRVREDV